VREKGVDDWLDVEDVGPHELLEGVPRWRVVWRRRRREVECIYDPLDSIVMCFYRPSDHDCEQAVRCMMPFICRNRCLSIRVFH
jgi:hypothetical protein